MKQIKVKQIKDFSKDARALNRFSQFSALAFVAAWGWGAGITIDAAGKLSGKSRGLAPKLAELGYIKVEKWGKSNHIKIYYTITKSGVEYAMENQDWARNFSREYGYPFSPMPDKIPSFKSHSAVHDLYCQIICVNDLMESEFVCGRALTYYSTPDLYGNFAAGEKVPDFIIERERSIDVIEFENSKKSRAELLNFVDYYYRWSGRMEGEKRRRVFVWCINSGIRKQFENIWKPGNLVAPFARDASGRWMQNSELGLKIEEEATKRHVYIDSLRDGMAGLLFELREREKLAKIAQVEEEDYV